jgi:hypothetical protein
MNALGSRTFTKSWSMAAVRTKRPKSNVRRMAAYFYYPVVRKRPEILSLAVG